MAIFSAPRKNSFLKAETTNQQNAPSAPNKKANSKVCDNSTPEKSAAILKHQMDARVKTAATASNNIISVIFFGVNFPESLWPRFEIICDNFQ